MVWMELSLLAEILFGSTGPLIAPQVVGFIIRSLID